MIDVSGRTYSTRFTTFILGRGVRYFILEGYANVVLIVRKQILVPEEVNPKGVTRIDDEVIGEKAMK